MEIPKQAVSPAQTMVLTISHVLGKEKGVITQGVLSLEASLESLILRISRISLESLQMVGVSFVFHTLASSGSL